MDEDDLPIVELMRKRQAEKAAAEKAIKASAKPTPTKSAQPSTKFQKEKKEKKEEKREKDRPKSSSSSSSGMKSISVEIYEKKEPIPKRDPMTNELIFPDYPTFRPNLTPKEVLLRGSFGGGYFRPIYSRVTSQHYNDVWKELPKDWLDGLNVPRQLCCSNYNTAVNKWKVDCGGDLDMWENRYPAVEYP